MTPAIGRYLQALRLDAAVVPVAQRAVAWAPSEEVSRLRLSQATRDLTVWPPANAP